MQKKLNKFITILTLFILLFVFLFITQSKTNIEFKKNITINQKNQQETQITTIETTEETTENALQTFQSLLVKHYNTATIIPAIHHLVTSHYNQSYLKAQSDMLAALSKQKLSIEETSHLFLPLYPSHYTSSISKQLDIPLLLQKKQNWRSLAYGTDGTKQLGENGCAILTLAMLESYYTKSIISPKQILNWSKNEYYVDTKGTSWEIFYDYALSHNYLYEDFADDFDSAMTAAKEGKVVIASVRAGYFTDIGHLLIIRGYDGEKVYVNDPNDDVSKMHSLQGISKSIFLSEGLNYWALSK